MTSRKDWKHYSEELNKEFGGMSLNHCHTLNGSSVGVNCGILQPCCQSTHVKGNPTVCAYQEPTVNPAVFLRNLGEIIRKNQTDIGPCIGCRWLQKIRLPQTFASEFIHSITLNDFSSCNANCVYCTGVKVQTDEYVPKFDHTILFGNLFRDGLIKPRLSSVYWGGGEPTLLSTFEKSVDFLMTNEIFEVINTSGIRFNLAIERALSAGLARVRISVDAGTNEIYAKVKRNRHCDDVWESIRRYAATDGDFILKYIVFSMNSDDREVDCFINRAQEAGVKKVCISVDSQSLSGGRELTLKELTAASTMYVMAKVKNMNPYFESIWTPQHIKHIEEIGNFKVEPGEGIGYVEARPIISRLMLKCAHGLRKVRGWVDGISSI
jgi:pyruvate-formate lyase-activating enzyme